jgi:chromosome condensin MukBEF ATPase and DNA-binding subunit MukB
MHVARGEKVTKTNNQKKPEFEDAGQPAGSPRMSEDSQAFIGLKLRELYDDVVAEPVPDRILQLLQELGGDEKKPE